MVFLGTGASLEMWSVYRYCLVQLSSALISICCLSPCVIVGLVWAVWWILKRSFAILPICSPFFSRSSFVGSLSDFFAVWMTFEVATSAVQSAEAYL